MNNLFYRRDNMDIWCRYYAKSRLMILSHIVRAPAPYTNVCLKTEFNCCRQQVGLIPRNSIYVKISSSPAAAVGTGACSSLQWRNAGELFSCIKWRVALSARWNRSPALCDNLCPNLCRCSCYRPTDTRKTHSWENSRTQCYCPASWGLCILDRDLTW